MAVLIIAENKIDKVLGHSPAKAVHVILAMNKIHIDT